MGPTLPSSVPAVDAARFQRFTTELTAWAENAPDVIGLIALGSMADVAHAPDQWSDHDFWVVAVPEATERIRNDRSWLPDSQRVVLFFAESAHGRSVIYDDGHLIEHAVFAPDELEVAKANAYRVLVDKADVAARMERVATATKAAEGAVEPDVAFGRFVTQLVIGLSRYGRGEDLSARSLVCEWAANSLIRILRGFMAPAPGAQLDNIDPYRRLEIGYPSIADRVLDATQRPVPAAATRLLDIADDVLPTTFPAYDARAVQAVRSLIDRASAARPRDD